MGAGAVAEAERRICAPLPARPKKLRSLTVRRLRRFLPLLRPGPWRRLPRELWADRIATLAEALPEGLRGTAFRALLCRIDRGPLHAGDTVAVYTRGEEAFASMLAAIDRAEREVLVESYIVRDDFIGRSMLAALGRAVDRGVVVRVLADALGSSATGSGFWAEMARRGMEVHFFHPLLRHFGSQAFRDHRKIVVVDRQVAFTGGMNIGDDYGSSRHARRGLWRDTQVRVEGPTAWEMAVVFAEGWVQAGGGTLDLRPLEAASAEGKRVLVLDSRPRRGHAESASVLAAIIGAARQSVWITNSYFAPMRSVIAALTRAAARGVDVRLLLPGPIDVPLIRHAGHGSFAELLASGVRISEYQPSILHAKTLVADGYVSVIGSSNLDFRSFRFNAECNLVILDDGIGKTLAEAFQEDLTRAWPVEPKEWLRRGWAHRLGDRLARALSPLL